ncbi:SNF7 family protein [Cavenderia fasciculata]|uniref:SNF7 family protein n=1 Tax=Cavenderia fasciculata TaxID=261658 RepID=F4QEK3_CACFS|nr:SNF7 family protein [Cavenderia fasciculata]EGG14114.1 SNF7 family protein [Cavenderia fasciculata]|eukprot:XP_004350822.1 SNF7 family protein [Cavenderia fasciculata]
MGVFYSFCGGEGRKGNGISNTDKAVLDLKVQRDKLKQYQVQINIVIQKEIEIAKECTKTKKRNQALLALKKKKYQEKLLDDTNQNLINIQEMISKIELAEFQVKIFDSLKKGNTALNALQKEMSLEDVENLMAETEDAIAYQNEISAALAGQFSPEEEDSLLEELEAMEKQMTQFPKVPNNKLDVNLDHIIPAVEQPTKQAVQIGGESSTSTTSTSKVEVEPEQLVNVEDIKPIDVDQDDDIQEEEQEEEEEEEIEKVVKEKPKKQLEMAM